MDVNIHDRVKEAIRVLNSGRWFPCAFLTLEEIKGLKGVYGDKLIKFVYRGCAYLKVLE